MINKETIISVFNDKLTLAQWLKTVNKALDEAVLTGVEIRQKGNATFTFVFTFEDGSIVESNEIIVNQGESIVGANIVNGHLILTLSNDEELDAGNVKPVSSFSFNASRHLIVSYADGTSEDLGLIKGISGFTINESGHLIVSYDNNTSEDLGSLGDFSNVDFVAKTLEAINANVNNGLGVYITNCEVTDYYSKIIISNNIMYLVFNFKFKNTTENPITLYNLGTIYINVPSKYAEKVYDLNGHTAHDADINTCLITLFKGFICDDIAGTNQKDLLFQLINAPSADQVVVNPIESSGISLGVNEEKFVTARVMLTLF